MRGLLAMSILLSGLGALGCDAGPGAAPPTDNCAAPSPGSVDSLEIGAASMGDLSGMPTAFVPLSDGDGMALIRGAQGANMIGLVLHVAGSAAPACLAQQTIVTDTGGARITSASAPLTTYVQPDGTRLTHPLWLPADYPATFVVGVTAANQSVSLHLHLLLAK